MNALRAIVPAAGKGKRLQALSGDMPKAMYRVNGRPMLEITLENIDFIDDSNIYIVVGHAKEQILEHFGDRFHYAEQKQQLGTGHAVMECAEAFRVLKAMCWSLLAICLCSTRKKCWPCAVSMPKTMPTVRL